MRKSSSGHSQAPQTRWSPLLSIPLMATVVFIVLQNVKLSSEVTTSDTKADCSGNLNLPSPSPDDFALAFEESLGFFEDIPRKDWELMRNITLARVNNEDPKNPLKDSDKPYQWYQKNWHPDFSCRHDTKVGVGDGAKVRAP